MFRTKATWDMKRDCVAEWASESGEVDILLVAGSVYTVMRPDRITDPATRMFATVPPALALVTLAFSRDEFGLIEWAAGAVHAVAMAVWLGGLILLIRAVLIGPGDEDLVRAVRGFARLSGPALWATVLTGAVLLYFGTLVLSGMNLRDALRRQA